MSEKKRHKKYPLKIVIPMPDGSTELFDVKDMKENDWESCRKFMECIKEHRINHIKDTIAFKELELKILRRQLK
jgi:hypothetical protein